MCTFKGEDILTKVNDVRTKKTTRFCEVVFAEKDSVKNWKETAHWFVAEGWKGHSSGSVSFQLMVAPFHFVRMTW